MHASAKPDALSQRRMRRPRPHSASPAASAAAASLSEKPPSLPITKEMSIGARREASDARFSERSAFSDTVPSPS